MVSPVVTIVSLTIQDKPGIRDMYIRPFETVLTADALNAVTNRIESVTRGDPANKVTGNALAGIGAGLFMPSAEPERMISIPNGWGSHRLRFVLVVDTQNPLLTTPTRYYFQGYTDILDISLITEQVNPDTRFFINSYVKTNMVPVPGGGYRENRTESGQVVDGRLISSMSNNSEIYTLRPEDVFATQEGNYLAQSYADLTDCRIKKSNQAIISDRANAIPSNYVASLINNFRQAQFSEGYGSSAEDVYGRAINTCISATPDENPFIRLLGQQHGFSGKTNFSLTELEKIDPEISKKLHFAPYAEDIGGFSAADANDWSGRDIITQRAAMLAQAIPSLMTQMMLVDVIIVSNNSFLGTYDTKLSAAKAMTNGNAAPILSMFINRFNGEIAPDICFGNEVHYDLVAHVDLFGMTHIQLSIDGQPSTPYIAPTMADSLLSPIVSSDKNKFNTTVSSIEHVMTSSDTGTSISKFQDIVNETMGVLGGHQAQNPINDPLLSGIRPL